MTFCRPLGFLCSKQLSGYCNQSMVCVCVCVYTSLLARWWSWPEFEFCWYIIILRALGMASGPHLLVSSHIDFPGSILCWLVLC